MITINYYERVKQKPEVFTQLKCKELLFVHYKCPSIERLIGKWSQHNYILYILSGKIAYHTPGHSWLLTSGDAVFIKKGAGIMEKFFEETLCIMTFFIPDDYLMQFMREYHGSISRSDSNRANLDLIIPLQVTEMMKSYFTSIIPYFHAEHAPAEDLLELKFRELLLNILTNSANRELNIYLQTLQSPQADRLRQIMEANCLFNLSLEDYAKLCNRSLSSFKRDFQTVYKTKPGQWLLMKKLNYSHQLLLTSDKPINDICFESGFESGAHFSRAFKKHFGLPPLQYRRRSAASALPQILEDARQ
jgi:AraC-like DNA-binding protein